MRRTRRQGPKARIGFEPVLPEKASGERKGGEPGQRDAFELPADLQRIVEQLTAAARGSA
jgi:hypothetical protein